MMLETKITKAGPNSSAAQAVPKEPACRFCGADLQKTFVDLGMSPLCQTHIEVRDLNRMEPFYPLHVWICDKCFLVQLEEFVSPKQLFTEYAYFSSYSDSWVAHAKRYTELVQTRFGIDRSKKVMEVASNDGYLLQHFVRMGVPVLGIEPAANVAAVAVAKGIATTVRFFGTDSARAIVAEYGQADLLLGNNVLAHVPAINDFVGGMKIVLSAGGVITMEFPHLFRLMAENQFDTIYHEHFSYLSFYTVERAFATHGLTLFDVEELPTHGGSLRIFARHTEDETKPVTTRVSALRERETQLGVTRIETYASFSEKVREAKCSILEFLIAAKRNGKSIVGYGAPGKGNSLLNHCGIRTDFLDYTVDRSPYKQGRYTPGTRIPILAPERIRQTQPDYVFILPWNLKDEIMAQCAYIREWGGRFVVPIPEVKIY